MDTVRNKNPLQELVEAMASSSTPNTQKGVCKPFPASPPSSESNMGNDAALQLYPAKEVLAINSPSSGKVEQGLSAITSPTGDDTSDQGVSLPAQLDAFESEVTGKLSELTAKVNGMETALEFQSSEVEALKSDCEGIRDMIMKSKVEALLQAERVEMYPRR